jgi:serine/threonine-protein kinase
MVVRDTMGREQPKVLDFGIAKELRSGEPDLTSRGAFVGTPKYMAPEQFRKQAATGRTDLYASGLLLYTVLTGRPPFMPEDPVPADLRELPEDARMAWLHLHRLPRPIGSVSNELNDLLAGLLAKTPADRIPDARRALAALGATPEMKAMHETGSHRTEPELLPASLDLPPTHISATGGPVVGETTATPITRKLTRAGALGVVLGALFVAGLQLSGAPFMEEDRVEPVRVRAMPSSHAVCHDPVASTPTGADVWRGAQWLGQTPFVLSRPCHESWTVVFRHKAHVTLQVAFPRHVAEVESPLRLPELTGGSAEDVDEGVDVRDTPDAGPAPSAAPHVTEPKRSPRGGRAHGPRSARATPGAEKRSEAAVLPFGEPEDEPPPGPSKGQGTEQGRDTKPARLVPDARGASPLYF